MDPVQRQEQDGVARQAHGLPGEEVLSALDVSHGTGLTSAQVAARLAQFGPNAIMARRRVSALAVLLHQFISPVVYLLGGAAVLALYFGEWVEGGAIGVVLAANALIGFVTEIKAARSIEALRSLGSRSVRVRRGGVTQVIPAEQLVPGDIVLIEGGDGISADLRLVETSHLGADESTLTGESVAVDKSSLPVAADARLADRTSMLFKGTAVTRGSGVGVVVATGLQTELGRITRLVEEAAPENSPLEKRLARLSAQLVWATLALTAVIAGVGLAGGGDPFLIVEAAIALAVAAIPEGLPVVATLALARGMWRMARQNALIERLSAVETLGATTIILTDKTGTLTENRMTARHLLTHAGTAEIEAGGSTAIANEPVVQQLLEIAVLCNDATLGGDEGSDSGDPMELALLRAGQWAGIDRPALVSGWPLVQKHAFDTVAKLMATVHQVDGHCLYAVKGAPEAVIAKASRVANESGSALMDEAARAILVEQVDQLGRQGLRVLACAMKTAPSADAEPFEDLVFLGLIALEDPARADVPAAVRACQEAGIRVAMVTGDHAVTAQSIGRVTGLTDGTSRPVEGTEIAGMTDGDAADLLKADIFARVSPAEKLSLVRAYQARGEVVAMTGDGVNDAPALRQADIGIAMGLRGTDVAREAAAMILLDDAFPTIVTAVREGRVIFGNIRRFVAFLLSCNLGEVLVVGLAILSGLPLPLLPLQILFLNLVTDVFPAFALALGEGERGVMRRPPRDPKAPILGRTQWLVIAMQSLAMAAGTFGAMFLADHWLGLEGNALVTVTFLTLAFAQLWHVFNMRHLTSGIFNNEITRNPWTWAALGLCAALLAVPPYVAPLAQVLQLVPPDPAMWLIVLGMSLAPLLACQAVMLILGRRQPD